MPRRGDTFPSMTRHVIKVLPGILSWFIADAALACGYPDEGNTPLHRAVKKVELLPETVEWDRKASEAKTLAQYVVLLNHPLRLGGRCYWTVEVSASGKLWQRFFVTPDGKSVLAEVSGKPAPLAAWRRARKEAGVPPGAMRSGESTAAAG
jgi:hypothetical protein